MNHLSSLVSHTLLLLFQLHPLDISPTLHLNLTSHRVDPRDSAKMNCQQCKRRTTSFCFVHKLSICDDCVVTHVHQPQILAAQAASKAATSAAPNQRSSVAAQPAASNSVVCQSNDVIGESKCLPSRIENRRRSFSASASSRRESIDAQASKSSTGHDRVIPAVQSTQHRVTRHLHSCNPETLNHDLTLNSAPI